MKTITNRFGTGILYDETDLGNGIYCVCTACMSVWSDFLSFANSELEKGKGSFKRFAKYKDQNKEVALP